MKTAVLKINIKNTVNEIMNCYDEACDYLRTSKQKKEEYLLQNILMTSSNKTILQT